MNFNLIENSYVDWEKIEDEFTEKYLHSTMSNDDIREEFQMTHGEFRRYCNYVKEKYGLNRRPFWKHRLGDTKYYYKTRSGFIITKRVDEEYVYLGFVPNEDVAKKVVGMCKNALWDIGVSWLIVHNWRCIVT